MTDDWPPVVYLAQVMATQAASTGNRRLAARLRFARFPGRKTLDEFDFSFQPSVDRKLVMDLATLRFVKEGRPVLFLGQVGRG
jgi:DNA replication protein DnaC